MSSGEKQDSSIAAIAAQLTQTQSLIHSLLSEIRESSVSQATLKTELKQLRYNVHVLSNIIRGDNGNSRPLTSEVEVLKIADRHLDSRMTELVKDLENQLDDVANTASTSIDLFTTALAEHRTELEAKIDAAEAKRKEDETQRLQLQLSDKKDLRLDRRQRLQTWMTVVIAVISLVGSTVALLLKD